ncbi:hypothetical protein RFI_14498, partial [Reticulomyxa filosa]
GPFDILVHKLGSWYVAAQTQPEAYKQLKECLHYIRSCDTNLDFDQCVYSVFDLRDYYFFIVYIYVSVYMYPFSFDLDKKYKNNDDMFQETKQEHNDKEVSQVSGGIDDKLHLDKGQSGNNVSASKSSILKPLRRMYVLDHPFAAFRTIDRWHVYNILTNADLKYECKSDPQQQEQQPYVMTLSSPRSILLQLEELKELKQIYDEAKQKSETTDKSKLEATIKNHALYKRISELRYPVIAKSRIGVSPATKDAKKDTTCNAHRLRIIPSADLVIDNIEITEDWMLQEYIPHSGVFTM